MFGSVIKLRTLCTSSILNLKEIPEVTPTLPDPNVEPGSDVHWQNTRTHAALGPIYRQSIGESSIIFVSDPTMCRRILAADGKYPKFLIPPAWLTYNKKYGVKRGLFFAEGKEWLKMRKALNPIFFDKKKLGAALPSYQITDRLIDTFHDGASRTSAIDNLEYKMHSWAVQSTLRSLFGSKYDSSGWDEATFIASIKSFSKESAELQFLDDTAEADKDTPLWNRFKTAIDTSLHLMKELFNSIDFSKDHNLEEDDCLVAAMVRSNELSHNEILRIASDLVIAAADTSSLTAYWALHLAAKEGESMQQKLSEYNDRFAVCFLKEVTRLYPVAPFITRIIQNPVSPEPGVFPELAPGQLILLSTFAMGRDNKLFPPDASEFWPGRWERNSKGSLAGVSTPFAWLPFGHGARACIGREMAMKQIIYLLRRVTTEFALTNLNERPVELKMRMVGLPDDEIKIGLTEKSKNYLG